MQIFKYILIYFALGLILAIIIGKWIKWSNKYNEED